MDGQETTSPRGVRGTRGMRGSGQGAALEGAALTLAVVLGIGLLLGSIWSSRGQDVFGGGVYLPGGRAVAVVLLPLWAYALARRPIPGRVCLAIAGAAAAGHVACLLLAQFWAHEQDLAALGFAACVLDGIFIALAFPCLLEATLRLDHLRARLAIALGLTLATVYDLVFANLGAAVALGQWIVADFAVLALCGLCMRGSAADEDGESTGAVPPARAAGRTDGQGRAARSGDLAPWAAATALACLLMLIQGLVVQATGYGGAGTGARFGVAGDIISFTTRLLVVLYCLLIAASPRPLPCVAGIVGVWCLSLVITVLGWDSGAARFGELLLEAGYNVLQSLVLLWAYDVARVRREISLQVFCVAAAAMLANQVTRVVGLFAIGAAHVGQAAAVAGASVLSLGILAVAAMVVLLALSSPKRLLLDPARSGSHAAGASPSAALKAEPAGTSAAPGGDPASFASQSADFCRRFEAACDARGLTQREREVLFTAIHGYTIDNIAERLSISRETVKSNLARAYARAGVNGKQAFLSLMDEM